MRNPARVDRKVKAIEDTRRFLEGYMKSELWKADRDPFASVMRETIKVIERSNSPDWAKNFAAWALSEQAKKRSAKPTRHHRDEVIGFAALRLVGRGYLPTRNDVMRHRASASSIICEALHLLGEKTTEKRINAVLNSNPFLKTSPTK
jgi:hypothetical protein